ncbi:hypothetical protein F5B22DRAFT_630298 [Xylaria bambusicola]|uniref:uncharacterized protein n=1 Tax=Xylaria bambusicola TaxID=326684 RepID=UPI002008A875|nr:uncharacterized protein F5B22DRAFT_630298 [Xylaria bambusicola]KAI0503193.1 hypothetical protein F5B22DRAFT_630298 [Xylaria bambusicola]
MPGDTWELFKRYDNSNETPSGFNYRSTVEGLLIPFFIISWICVLLRIHTRYRLQCLGWDDLFVVLFRIIATVGTAFVLLLFDYGFGKHFWALGPSDRSGFLKTFYIALLSYTISTILTKLCLLTQYLRLFEDDRRVRKICWFFIVVSALWGLAFGVIAIVPCVPLSGFWNWEEKSYCYGFGSKDSNEIGATYAAHVSTNVILDLGVLAIPIPLYFQTFRQKKQRLGFSVILLLGIGVNIISIWRLYTIIKTRAGTYPVADPTFYAPQSIVLAALEVDLASIVASIPVFWPIITQTWGKIWVTQEVHVTRHHRRLSGNDDTDRTFELPHFASSERSRRDSDGSLKLVIMDTDGVSSSRSRSHHRRDSSSSRAPERPPPAMVGGYDKNDPYVRGRVYPLEGACVSSEAQVVSEGQRGFERNYREHFGQAPPLLADIKADEIRYSSDRPSKDGERSWSLSISRKSSRRF